MEMVLGAAIEECRRKQQCMRVQENTCNVLPECRRPTSRHDYFIDSELCHFVNMCPVCNVTCYRECLETPHLQYAHKRVGF